MAVHHEDDLPTLDAADLSGVTGGAGFDLMSMLPFLLMRNAFRAAAAPAAAAPAEAWKPKITLNGVEQPVTTGSNGTTFSTSV